MNRSLDHRGPDDSGEYFDNAISLGHTRLSIIDLSSRGHQPMRSKCERYVISYNGELYNFRELRTELESSGVRFSSESDTEVILYALIEWGINALPRFNGMFALAFWDAREQALLLARDRFGIKPLYWCEHDGTLVFGSEIKSLIASGLVTRELDSGGLGEYVYYGNALGRNTLFKGVNRLLSDHVLVAKRDTGLQEMAVQRAPTSVSAQTSYDEAAEKTESLLTSAVDRHLIADVPVALLLSSGLDSSVIGMLASRSHDITTISIGFEGREESGELAEAGIFARRVLGTSHIEHTLNYNDVASTIDAVVEAHDQPFGDAANVPLYLIAEAVRDSHKVVLQGDGGDEVFGGYRRYSLLRHATLLHWLARSVPVPAALARISRNLRRVRRMLDAFGQRDPALRTAYLLTEEWVEGGAVGSLFARGATEQFAALDPFARYREVFAQVKSENALASQLAVDMRILLPDIFLEKVDRPTMAHGIEVRVPMLDQPLVDYVSTLPGEFKIRGRSTKRLLRSIIARGAPRDVATRPKRGFGVPYGKWLMGPLRERLQDSLLSDSNPISDMFDKGYLTRLIKEHTTGSNNHAFLLYKMLMLFIWSEKYLLRDSSND